MLEVMGGRMVGEGRQPCVQCDGRGVRGVSHVQGDDKGGGGGVRGVGHVQGDGRG